MNRRARICLLFLAAAAAAQANPDVDRAIDPTTSPSERIALLQRIVETPERRLELSRRGLDPSLDPEVIHAVVEALLAAADPGEHIEPICRLLLSTPLRERVQHRIQRVAEDAAQAQKLIAKLEQLALGKTVESAREPRQRVAAVRALGSIPRRTAVEIIVVAWHGDQDADVRKECRAALDGVVPAPTPAQAEAWLRERPYSSYYDLVKEFSRNVLRELEMLKAFTAEILQTADARNTFRVLEENPSLADVASKRVLQLAEEGANEGKVGGMPVADFASRVFVRFQAEKAQAARLGTIANLGNALAALARPATRDALFAAVPVAKLSEATAEIAGKNADWSDAGEACVKLLAALGDPAKAELIRFAGRFGSALVRAKAAGALGQLARQNVESQHFIGLQLSALLEKEKEPEVRQQILFSLGSAPVEAAVAPIRALLFPAEGKSVLTGTEPRYCIAILSKVETPAALEVLQRLTREGEPDVRKTAAVSGLIPRLNGGPDHEQVADHLRTLVLDGTQPLEVREEVVVQLGEQGKRAADTILRVARSEQADELLRAKALSARLRLAERLAVAGAEAEDLAAANRILREEWSEESQDRIESIARAVVQLADSQSRPAGDARSLVALIQLARKPDDPAALLSLFREARDKAPADRPAPAIETRLLLAYRDLLKDATGEDRFDRFVAACLRLAELAGDDTQQAWGFWLDAIERVVDGPKNRAWAERLYKDMPKNQNGGLEGPASARWGKIKERLNALPEKKPDNQ